MASFNLEDYRIKDVPDTAFYVPNFITKEEEASLLGKIEQTPGVKWTQLSNRRLQNWGGVPHQKGMIAEEIPDWLMKVVEKVNTVPVLKDHPANHVLLNEYLPGQGIMPHLDGDLFHPIISTVSLQSHAVLNFYKPVEDEQHIPYEERIAFKFLIEPRSLLILKDDMFNLYLHGIDEVKEDLIKSVKFANTLGDQSILERDSLPRECRISLTIRKVPKTSKMKIKFGK